MKHEFVFGGGVLFEDFFELMSLEWTLKPWRALAMFRLDWRDEPGLFDI